MKISEKLGLVAFPCFAIFGGREFSVRLAENKQITSVEALPYFFLAVVIAFSGLGWVRAKLAVKYSVKVSPNVSRYTNTLFFAAFLVSLVVFSMQGVSSKAMLPGQLFVACIACGAVVCELMYLKFMGQSKNA